jgi:hypothetical protein
MVRVPRVSRLEYVVDFLDALDKGLSREQVEEKVAARKQEFEVEKYRALAKGAPFSERQKQRLMNAGFIIEELELLCRALGLVNRAATAVEEPGRALLALAPERRKTYFGRLLFEAYPVFGAFLLALKDSPDQKLSFPDVRHSAEHAKFRQVARAYGLDMEVLTFTTIRDLLALLDLVNWGIERRAEAGSRETWFAVYLASEISEVARTAERTETASGPLTILGRDGRTYSVSRREVEEAPFNKVMWEEYLRRTNWVQLRPVFYSDLRAATCERLRTSDSVFDEHISRLLERGAPFSILWSGGTIPFSKESGRLLKNLPPRSPEGQYMVYLKIGRASR